MENELHVIFGTGPAGCWTARALRKRGYAVRAINRSGVRPVLMPDDVDLRRADLSDSGQAVVAAAGATTVYQALNPPYHQWHEFFPALQSVALYAASKANARYVSLENLYMYDCSGPITEGSPMKPVSKKGALRQKMAEDVMAANTRGDVRATALRSSDYYGPGVVQSALGEMVFGNLVAGKKAQVAGAAGVRHSFAYIEDVGVAAATLGTDHTALGQAWIAPHAHAETQGDLVQEACRILGMPPAIGVISPWLMRMVGLFVPAARASVEMMYQFMSPFEVDSSRIEREFGLAATPVSSALESTIGWYRNRHNPRGS